MSFLQGLFGPPNVNIEEMKAKRDVNGLIRALNYKKKKYRDNEEEAQYKQVRWIAAKALGEIGDARAVKPLITTLQDTNSTVRWKATEALANIGAPAAKPLIAALKHSNNQVRLGAANALGNLKDDLVVEPLIEALINDSDLIVRENAANALGNLKDTRAIEPLIVALKDIYGGVREAAASALGNLKNACTVEPLIAALKDNHSDVRKAAADALDMVNWKPGQDEIGAAYWGAKQEWGKCIEIGIPAVDPLIFMLKDGNKAAAVALVRLYHQNNIDAPTKQKILAQRNVITEQGHDDIPACMEPHADRIVGIGVDFPL
jgi:HEAT repeat protein